MFLWFYFAVKQYKCAITMFLHQALLVTNLIAFRGVVDTALAFYWEFVGSTVSSICLVLGKASNQ